MARSLARTSAAALVISLVVGCAESRPAEEATTIPAASRPPASPAASRPPAASLPPPAADIGLDLVADGLVAPVGLVTPGGDGNPSFVVDQTGLILMLRDGQLIDDPYLDLSDRLVRLDTEYDERGLLGLEFHPAFAENGRLFVY